MNRPFIEIIKDLIFYMDLEADILKTNKNGYIAEDILFSKPVEVFGIEWRVLHIGNILYVERTFEDSEDIVRFEFKTDNMIKGEYYHILVELDKFINGENYKNFLMSIK